MKYFVCNFKNNLCKNDIIKYNRVLGEVKTNAKLIILPSDIFIPFFDKKGYSVGTQDLSSFIDKTVTGETTASQIKSMGADYVLVGHSERRIFKKEINIDFINKITSASDAGLTVIYAIGETKEDREKGDTYITLEKQISEVLNNVEIKNMIIAYEPVWAIGTGNVPTNYEILDVIDFIKDIIMEKYDKDLPVLYGGSVNKENIKTLLKLKNLDGFLVGGASLNPQDVLECLTVIDSFEK